MKWIIEAIVDLVYPPDEGDEPIPFWRKLAVLIALVLMVLFVILLRL